MFQMDKTIKSYNKNAKPVVGHLKAPNEDAHAVVVIGAYDVTMKYRKKIPENIKQRHLNIMRYAMGGMTVLPGINGFNM